jgi:hypothetical protein
VDSVYIDRRLPQARVDGGDFAAYLLARLGAGDLPPDFGYRVSMDTSRVLIGGRVMDLPPQAKQSLSQLVLMLPPETWIEADVRLLPAGREGVRFHLQGASVQGIAIPEMILGSILAGVGKQYPALTASSPACTFRSHPARAGWRRRCTDPHLTGCVHSDRAANLRHWYTIQQSSWHTMFLSHTLYRF